MVAEAGVEVRRELPAEFFKAFAGALKRGVIAHADEGGIAGIIAVGDDVVRPAGAAMNWSSRWFWRSGWRSQMK